MHFFQYAGAFFVAVFVLILIHETGHFLVAKLFKVKVERISIGFGKPFYTWKTKKGNTEYVLAPILLGGYVKLLDTRETNKSSHQYSAFAFDHKPIIQRLAIIAAGPLANIIFAFFAFWLMFVIGFKSPKPIIGRIVLESMASVAGMHASEEIIRVDERDTDSWSEVIIAMLARVGDEGSMNIITQLIPKFKTKIYEFDLKRWEINSYEPDPLLDFGLIRYRPLVLPKVYSIAKNSPAEKSGVLSGDRIIAIEGNKVHDWEDFVRQIKLYPKKKIKLLIERDKKIIDLTATTGWKFGSGWKKIGFLGVGPDVKKITWPQDKVREYKYAARPAFTAATHQMKLFIELNGFILDKLLTGKMSFHVLGGPIATFTASGQALEQGFVTFLGFLAIISLTIALINLLPLPGLDGGQFVLILVEGIRRRPISMQIQMLIFRLGMAIFVLVILQATANDLVRIFGR